LIYRGISIFIVFFFVSAALLAAAVSADEWALPKKKKYYSSNRKYYLEVTPKQLESQLKYFENKVDKKENTGAVSGVKDNRAKAALYVRRSDGHYSRKSEFALVNEVSPVTALVSNDGNYVVTFDNWHSVGYGDDVVVLYRSNGVVIKKFALGDLLTEGDIETLPRSVSSIWWGGDHYIHDSNRLLVLKIISNRKNPWEDGATFRELKMELATGRTLEPKHDLFPQPRVFGSVDAATVLEPSQASPSEPICSAATDNFDSTNAVHISSEQLFAKAKERPLPPYPVVAKAAHAEGTVIVEVLVSTSGDVICARSLSGHPLFRAASIAAVRKWKFEPVEVGGQSAKVVGTVAINFKLTEKDMNPNHQPRD